MATNTNWSADNKVGITLSEHRPDLDMANYSKDDETAESVRHATVVLPPVKRMGILELLRTYKYASLVCVLAAVGALSDGYQVQMSGSIVALRGFILQFGDPKPDGTYVINPQYIALWGAIKNIAAMFGGASGSYFADKFGRKWMILMVQIIMLGACTLEQLSTHWTHWLGARILDGFSIGLAQCCINVYISEMAPTAGRGALMSLVQLFYSIGSFISSVSLNVVSQDVPSHWRHAVLSQFALSGAAICAWIFLPESARWHCWAGREAEAKKILRKINGNVKDYDVDQEYHRMQIEVEHLQISAAHQRGGTYADVFRGTNLRRLIISFLPWHWQVAIGVPIVGTYSSYFFNLAGLSNPFNGTVATNIVTIAMLFVAVPLIERLGRRTLLIWCSPISIVSIFVMGSILKTSGPAVGPLLVTFACLWTVGLNLSASPMGYVYVAETATQTLRAKTTGIAVFGIQAMAAIYVYIAPIMLNSSLGMSNTLYFWAGTGTAVYILVWFLVPETKGRTFAELDELFDRKIPAWKFAQTETQADIQRHQFEGMDAIA